MSVTFNSAVIWILLFPTSLWLHTFPLLSFEKASIYLKHHDVIVLVTAGAFVEATVLLVIGK